MATNFARIRAALGVMSARVRWTPEDLRKALIDRDKKRNEKTFSMTSRGSHRVEPFSDAAFDRLFFLMADLTLITQTAEEELAIDDTAKRVLTDEKRFQELITRKVMRISGRPRGNDGGYSFATQKIQLPEIRNPETILERLQAEGAGEKLSPTNFSRLLFLLACAKKRATRHMKIFYEFS